MSQLIFTIAVLMPIVAMAGWTVPENPNPSEILDELKMDCKAGRYEDSLAKQIWFHNHSLEYQESLYGVRLSFALIQWRELGRLYPPALNKLKTIRNETAAKVLIDEEHVRPLFHDICSINRYLQRDDLTVETFILLETTAPDMARKVYDLAQPALVKAKEFDRCGRYLDPKEQYWLLARDFDWELEHAKEMKASPLKRASLELSEEMFLQKSTTLIALLVLNDRKPEATEIAKKTRKESSYPDRDAVINSALEGELPPQKKRSKSN